MARAAWVAGIVHSFREGIDTTHTGYDLLDPQFLQLSCLIQKDDIILSTLVLVQILVIVTVAKFDGASVRECEDLLRLVVLGNAIQFLLKEIDVVVHKFREGSSDD